MKRIQQPANNAFVWLYIMLHISFFGLFVFSLLAGAETSALLHPVWFAIGWLSTLASIMTIGYIPLLKIRRRVSRIAAREYAVLVPFIAPVSSVVLAYIDSMPLRETFFLASHAYAIAIIMMTLWYLWGWVRSQRNKAALIVWLSLQTIIGMISFFFLMHVAFAALVTPAAGAMAFVQAGLFISSIVALSRDVFFRLRHERSL